MHTLPLDASCKDDVVFVFLADLGALVEVFLLLTASQIKKHWVNYLVKKKHRPLSLKLTPLCSVTNGLKSENRIGMRIG